MDRGHMAPKADFDYNATAALNTFLLSNVAPQYHIFNIGNVFYNLFTRALPKEARVIKWAFFLFLFLFFIFFVMVMELRKNAKNKERMRSIWSYQQIRENKRHTGLK